LSIVSLAMTIGAVLRSFVVENKFGIVLGAIATIFAEPGRDEKADNWKAEN
jgi:hypothetical protein